MKWKLGRRSTNIQDRRGRRMAFGGGLGLGGIAIVVIVALLLGKNPLTILGLIGGSNLGPAVSQQGTGGKPPANDEAANFVASILGETEDVWISLFQRDGSHYPAPTLVLFDGAVRSACGMAQSAVGPFYCPGDHQIYIDLGFFHRLRQMGGGGDFANAYVIAHEVGHHVQTLTGVSDRVNAMRAQGMDVEGAGGALVRQELQADCFAGVWAYHAQRRHHWLEPGDLEEALNTASAIGDDTLQRRSRGTVVPDAFTHGTSEQRVHWFRNGFNSGNPERCNTFAAASL